MCFCVNTPCSIYIVDSLTLGTHRQRCASRPDEASLTHPLSLKAHPRILGLQHARQPFSTMPGVILKSQITKSTEMQKRMWHYTDHKGHLYTGAETRRQSVAGLFDLSGHVSVRGIKVFTILGTSVQDHSEDANPQTLESENNVAAGTCAPFSPL